MIKLFRGLPNYPSNGFEGENYESILTHSKLDVNLKKTNHTKKTYEDNQVKRTIPSSDHRTGARAESIKEAIKKHDIRNGAVVSGVGTLKRCHLHYVDTSTFPPVNKFYVIDEPLEIGSISGLIADYEPHLHITVGCRENKAWNGHLENDSVARAKYLPRSFKQQYSVLYVLLSINVESWSERDHIDVQLSHYACLALLQYAPS